MILMNSFSEYFRMHIRLFENIINNNEFDGNFDFINLINCFKNI